MYQNHHRTEPVQTGKDFNRVVLASEHEPCATTLLFWLSSLCAARSHNYSVKIIPGLNQYAVAGTSTINYSKAAVTICGPERTIDSDLSKRSNDQYAITMYRYFLFGSAFSDFFFVCVCVSHLSKVHSQVFRNCSKGNSNHTIY